MNYEFFSLARNRHCYGFCYPTHFSSNPVSWSPSLMGFPYECVISALLVLQGVVGLRALELCVCAALSSLGALSCELWWPQSR